jgi:hypothetical protein
MTKHKSLLLLSMPLFLLLVAGCAKSKDPNYKKVTITGSSFCANYSRSYSYYGSIAEENDSSALMVADGDLLYIMLGEEGLIFRYKDTDGLQLSLTVDTTDNFIFYKNQELISLNLSDEYNAWDWIEEKTSDTFKNLRSLYISSSLSEKQVSTLKKISEVSTNLGLVLEFEEDQQMVENIIALFNPTWLVLPDIKMKNIKKELTGNLKNLEFLSLTGDNLQDLDFIYQLPRLQSLIIEGWDPETNGGFRFRDLRSLESLALIESEIISLSSIGILPDLKSLHFVECDTLSDINTINQFTGLKSLGFTQCDKISDISSINDIPSLTWLSFPPNISQENFNIITDKHLLLQVVELIECEKINDLSPLKKLNDLRAITLAFPITDFTPLYNSTGLELIILDKDVIEESGEKISELQHALPDTKIIPGGGLCLGSGWILLLIPIVLMIRIILIFRKSFKC